MPKFPDPTREYTAQAVDSSLDVAIPATNTTPLPKTSESVATQPIYESKDPTQILSPEKPIDNDSVVPPVLASEPYNPPPVVPPPVYAKPKFNLAVSPFSNFIPLVVGGIIFILLLTLAIRIIPGFFSKKTVTTLTYWGLWEPSSVMQGVIADYEKLNPNIKVAYTMQSPKNYRSRLESSIQQGTAPDIARIHNTWLPVMRKSLTPAPEAVVPATTLNDYYPIIKKDFFVGGKTYALPLMIDGLALYYNIDMFAEVGGEPPADWNALRKLAFSLTKKNATTGIIERSGIALGTTGNVDHWSDILGLLILQNSGNPGLPTEQAVQDAITFYTVFSTQDKIWDETQPNSTYAFATGTVAMIIAPSWQSASIKAINPDLNFKVAVAPTLPTTQTAWATYWGEAVPSSSKNSTEAWKFIKYLSSQEVLQKLYSVESQIRPIGEIYPRPDLGSLLSTDPIAGAYVNQASNYSSWYLASKTFDESLNDELIKYYEDTINGINQGAALTNVLSTLDSGVKQILAKYPEAK